MSRKQINNLVSDAFEHAGLTESNYIITFTQFHSCIQITIVEKSSILTTVLELDVDSDGYIHSIHRSLDRIFNGSRQSARLINFIFDNEYTYI